ncbi:MAG: ABC transporter substrate-binding protein [Chloroflexi bacterium]|nr:ABC transporter substrate-binding protein [Chloroflexota bacterium]
MKMRGLFFLVSIVAISGLLSSSCALGVQATPGPRAVAPPAATAMTSAPSTAKLLEPSPTPKLAAEHPKYGGVLTWAGDAEPGSFDVHQETGGQHPLYLMPVYNGLLQHDPLAWPEAKIIPDLAMSWEISSDGLEYTFRLRSGVKWHDDKPFSSADVKASVDRIRMQPRGTRSPRQVTFGSISDVEAVAPDVVRMRLRHPSASLFANLAIDWLAILPKHVIEAKGDMKRDILGTGPFKFKGSVPGSSYEYVKNGAYFLRGRPYLDGIRAYYIKDDSTRFAALRTGRILYQPYPRGITPIQAEKAKSEPHLVVQSNWRPTLYLLLFNLQRSPWSDVRVRRAVSLAIDRQAFIPAVMGGAGVIGAHMPSRGLWGIPEEELLKMPGYRQPKDADIAEARRLLAEAGFPDGFKTTILTTSEAFHERQGTFLLNELAKLGIKGELVMRTPAAFDDALARGAFDMMGRGTSAAVDDPDPLLGDNYVTGGGRNFGKYSNAEFDELYQKQSQSLNTPERRRLVREMLTILIEDSPNVTFCWGVTYIAFNSRVMNFRLGSSPYVNNRHQEVWLAD